MGRLALEYFGLVFVAVLGVLQVVAAYNRLRGVSFFRRRVYSYLFAVLTMGSALAGLFTWNWRNPIGIIQGGEQFVLFILALIMALALTLVVSSLLYKRCLQKNYVQHDGLELLREKTIFQVVRQRFGRRGDVS
jgi:hypothetical protein